MLWLQLELVLLHLASAVSKAMQSLKPLGLCENFEALQAQWHQSYIGHWPTTNDY